MKNKTMYEKIDPNHSSYPYTIKLIELKLSKFLDDLHSTNVSLSRLDNYFREIEKDVISLDDEKDYKHVKDKLLDSIPTKFEIDTLVNQYRTTMLKLIHLIERYYPDHFND
mgnify:CR=1 FL=1|jgi:hypothetical protein